MKPTNEDIKEYFSSPYACPYCGSENIEPEDRQYEDAMIIQRVECKDCSHTWSEYYTLSSIFWLDDDTFSNRDDEGDE